MKKVFVLIGILCSLNLFGQKVPKEMKISDDGTRLTLGMNETKGFYDEAKNPVIELTFPSDNFISMLNSTREDIIAKMTVDGVVYDSVGVRIKGLTSRSVEKGKYSFNITVDAFKKQDVKGYETLNLNNGYEDPSFVREILFNHVGRNYGPSLKTNYAQLYINGEYWGPYANVQQLNGEFIREWFASNDGTRWRAINKEWSEGFGGGFPLDTLGGGPSIDTIWGENPFDTLGGQFPIDTFGGEFPNDPNFSLFGEGKSTLNFLGADTAYIPHYQLKKSKKENPWEDLAINTAPLNTLPTDNDLYDNLKNNLDIDKALWFIAHENIFTDSDGYLYKGGMDYYVYWEAETGRLIPLEYDGNSVMVTGEYEMNWTPFYREYDERFPLVNRLLASPELRQRYLAHYRTILADYFTPEYMDMLIDGYANQIRASIGMDTKRIYGPAAFESELLALKNHVRARRDFLLNKVEINSVGLDISQVTTITQSPSSGESTLISAIISGDKAVDKVRLYYGEGLIGTFESIEMSDNGQGNYSAAIPGFTEGKYIRYYVEAIAADNFKTATFSPKGAEHDVFIYRVSTGEVGEPTIVINELVASNDAVVADQDGEFDDWIELYNTTTEAIDLTGYFLTDNALNLDKYDIPEGTIVPAKDYLIIWADEDGIQEGLHANFKLSRSGESLFLVNADTVIIDEVIFDKQTTDIAYARFPNGTGSFETRTPTFNSNNNDGTTGIDELLNNQELVIYPNPASQEIFVQLTNPIENRMDIEVYDVFGRLVLSKSEKADRTTLGVQDLLNGFYFIVVNQTVGQKIVINRA